MSKKKSTAVKESFIVEGLEVLEISESETGVKKATIKIITEGLTKDRQRFYTKDALLNGVPLFENAKMYLNHISASERMDRPERSVQDYVATIKNASLVESGGRSFIKGDAFIHGSPSYTVEQIHTWLKNAKEAGATSDLSIHAFLFGEQGEFEGRPTTIITGIDQVLSVDFVTTANAGGEIESVESFSQHKEGGAEMDITKLTLDELKTARPDLVVAISSESKKESDAKIAETQKIADAAKSEAESLKKELSDKKLAEKKESLMRENDALIKDAKLPEATEKRVREKVAALAIDDKTESLKTDVESIIKSEKEYLESLSKTKVFANDDDETADKSTESVESLLKKIGKKNDKKEEK